MKFFLHFILSVFLAINIVAPSVMLSLDTDESMGLVLDQTEDENKESEKENSDKDTFYHVWKDPLSPNLINIAGNNTFYFEGYFNPTLNIVLPPPKTR